jgi:hypothetical protein
MEIPKIQIYSKQNACFRGEFFNIAYRVDAAIDDFIEARSRAKVLFSRATTIHPTMCNIRYKAIIRREWTNLIEKWSGDDILHIFEDRTGEVTKLACLDYAIEKLLQDASEVFHKQVSIEEQDEAA